MKKATVIWLVVCAVSFGAGYGANELTFKKRVRDEFVRAVTWAVEQGLPTVNGEKVNELGQGDERD